MKLRRMKHAILTALLAGLWTTALACGPDFEPDVYMLRTAPDIPAQFVRGRLGILRANFDSNDLAVAYRYLNGGRLSAREIAAYYAPAGTPASAVDWGSMTPQQIAAARAAVDQTGQAANAPGQWAAARNEYILAGIPNTQPPATPPNNSGDIDYNPAYVNCSDSAFRTATLTLEKRAAAWGKQSPWLADWLHGQDAVFSHCFNPGTTPAAAPANSPVLLQQDRAYQIAAANFYARNYDAAANEFEAIARDSRSPWSGWGDYLAARAIVRKAFTQTTTQAPYPNLANFNMDTMRQAQQMLESLLARPNPTPSRRILQDELNFVLIRTDPEKRVAEISAALAGPREDENFANDLADLSFVLSESIPIHQPAPLLAWIEDWRMPPVGQSPFAIWQQSRSLPWLVLALDQAPPSKPGTQELLAAAEAVQPGTPGYDTVFFERVRLLIALKRSDEARTLLDGELPQQIRMQPSSEANALLGERMAVARSFDEFLKYAPRMSLSASPEPKSDLKWSCAGNPEWLQLLGRCPTPNEPPGFDVDSAKVLNQETPLALLIEAARSQRLPPNLREEVALAAWTRSVVLEDAASAARLEPLLPRTLRDGAGDGVGFAADVAVLRNPGLRPYVESGSSRLANFGELDDYRDNWWSSNWQGRYQSESPQLDQPEPLAFMTKEQVATGKAEYARTRQVPDGVMLLGQRVVDYARAHPGDPVVPEALALTVRATRYGAQDWGSDYQARTAEITTVGKAAFELLHRRYPKSPWTAKTPYYF